MLAGERYKVTRPIEDGTRFKEACMNYSVSLV